VRHDGQRVDHLGEEVGASPQHLHRALGLPAMGDNRLLVVAGLTTIPARLGARSPVAEILQAELA
jgi:hypothetical protein